MSGSFELVGNKFVITNGSRTVATTDGTLLQFLTAEQTFSTSISFPDAAKTQLYTWKYTTTRAPGDNFVINLTYRTAVGAQPQEWSNAVVLGSAPAGADLFVGRAILTRTAAPSHTWAGQLISPVIPQSVAIQLTGSMLVELAPGLARALTVEIVSGQLVASLQHSVGPAAGNFGQQGFVPVAISNTSISPNHTRTGVENVSASGVAALPVFWRNEAPYNNSAQYIDAGLLGQNRVASFGNTRRFGGASAASYDDPTNYASTYSLTVRGRFGRRS